ncbi:MAG: tetratricopeptide repeat protein [Pyrinomonadaceae bacterium]|nr:tetratricopeptide repeat protein [Pyrinomonadaceae bacterium]
MRNKILAISALIVVNFILFSNSLTGEFVYDDTRQIVRNPLIQDPSLYGKALVSDVWAFKGDGTYTASNYWRPTFTAYHILNFRLFGLDPFGWHFLNLALHAVVCLLIFLLLLKWEASPGAAFSIALLFAVHPVHVESVAWISGSPDILFAASALASFWFADKWARSKRNFLSLIVALIFYGLALGSKEVALLCFPIYFLIFSRRRELNNGFADENDVKLDTDLQGETQISNSKAAATFAFLAGLYFVFRWMILGRISESADSAAGLLSAVISAPSIFVFYLKQIVFPLTVGTNYALRPIETVTLMNFGLPLLIAVAAIALMIFFMRRGGFIEKIGFALFILPLIPAFNISAFVPEQIVHDRYLYLPVMGFLTIIVPSFAKALRSKAEKRSDLILIAISVILSVPLAFQTFASNRVWKNDLTLWEHNIAIDPSSSSSYMLYGSALSQAGKHAEALEAYNRSLDNRQTALGLMGRARANIFLGNNEEAVWDLKTVVEMDNKDLDAYTLYQTYEALSLALSQEKKNRDAAEVLREARKRLPIYMAALTEKLAIVLYQQNRKDEALRELETAKPQARRELLPESKNVFMRSGMLYAELGQNQKAREDLQEFLRLTQGFNDKGSLENRRQVTELLKSLN